MMDRNELEKKIDDELACYWVSTTPTKRLVKYEVAKKFIMDLYDQPQPTLGLDWRDIEKKLNKANDTKINGAECLSLLNRTLMDIISTLKNQEAERTTPKEKRWVVVRMPAKLNTNGLEWGLLNTQSMIMHRFEPVGCLWESEPVTQAECDRLNGEQKEKYRAVSNGIYANKVGHILNWKMADAVEKQIILDALNKQTEKEGKKE